MESSGSDERVIEELEEAIFRKKRELSARYRESTTKVVGDYRFTQSSGGEATLSELFRDSNDLILIHNMGKSCSFCTMWADGFNGLLPYIENRAAFVVCTPDDPETQQQLANKRGWMFDMVTPTGPEFTADMGFIENSSYKPGISTFHKGIDGTVSRIATRKFGPHDDFCSAWSMFDILKDGINGWTPHPDH